MEKLGQKYVDFCPLNCIFEIFPLILVTKKGFEALRNVFKGSVFGYQQSILRVPAACLEGTSSMSGGYLQGLWRTRSVYGGFPAAFSVLSATKFWIEFPETDRRGDDWF